MSDTSAGPPQVIAYTKPLPQWVQLDAAWAELGPAERYAMHVIWSLCDHGRPCEHGSVAGCYGGEALHGLVGASRSTFHRLLDRLMDAGFVVIVSRGGKLPKGEVTATVYGVPGHRGALDDVARPRRAGAQGKFPSPPERWKGTIVPLASQERDAMRDDDPLASQNRDARGGADLASQNGTLGSASHGRHAIKYQYTRPGAEEGIQHVDRRSRVPRGNADAA